MDCFYDLIEKQTKKSSLLKMQQHFKIKKATLLKGCFHIITDLLFLWTEATSIKAATEKSGAFYHVYRFQ